MLDRDKFDLLRRKHGAYASWAVWAEPTGGPKSNVGDLTILDPDSNPRLLGTLRTDVVMLGLNLARIYPEQDFRNFHDSSARAQDYRIRHAFRDTPYWGACMTDLVKGLVMLDSADVKRELAHQPDLVRASVSTFLGELDDLGGRPTIIAFGKTCHSLALRHVPEARYSRLVGVLHYSHYISKEDYRARVLGVLGSEAA